MNHPVESATGKGRQASRLRVGGLLPLTTIDFPEALSAVIFTQGCTLRCHYCQNGHLIPVRSDSQLAWSDIEDFLHRRQGLLDAVVFSGGEPTLQGALLPALQAVKAMGYKTGLHTAGTVPSRLEEAISCLDWVGFDIKALPEDYSAITGLDTGDTCWHSLRIVLDSGIPYEVRTTVHWQLMPPEKVMVLAQRLRESGVTHFVLQNCVTRNCLNPDLGQSGLDEGVKNELCQALDQLFPAFSVR